MARLCGLVFTALLLGACTAAPVQTPDTPSPNVSLAYPAPAIAFEPYVFTARGEKIDAEKGVFEVPENRDDPQSRKIKIGFVRFKSTSDNPGPPIVYLAGGPGGSGVMTAQGARFPLFMELRKIADVIALDQRGVGLSRTLPVCIARERMPASEPLTRDAIVAIHRREIARCFDVWEAGGADIDGYTTVQNAHDVEDLRRGLGVEKINLWGISYGSHLGLAIMRYHPGSVHRAVLAGIEGLDETIKLPSETDAYFARVQAAIDLDPKAKAAYPDLVGMMRRVHARLDANPAQASYTPSGATVPVTVTFDGFTVQLLAAGSISDPGLVSRLPLFYHALDTGKYEQAAQRLYGQFLARPLTFDGMPEAMDLASGVSPQRMQRLEKQFASSVLGDTLNFPMPHVAGIRPQIDLGESFRAPFATDVPTMFISGTLDGRTYPAEAAATAAGFRNGHRLIVENGGHNIYEADPRIGEAVAAFFRGEPAPTSIRFAPPTFATP